MPNKSDDIAFVNAIVSAYLAGRPTEDADRISRQSSELSDLQARHASENDAVSAHRAEEDSTVNDILVRLSSTPE